MINKYLKIFTVFILLTGLCHATDGTAGFEFLRTEYSSRAAGLGRSFVAMRGDANGLFHNPSSLAYIEDHQFLFNYVDYLIDFGGGFAAYSQRIKGYGQATVSIIWLDYGDFDETNEFAQMTGRTYGAYDIAFALSYADELETYFSYGVTLKYIHSKIDQYTASGFALDFGLLYAPPFDNRLFFGLSLLNVGKTFDAYITTKESLPMSLRVGVSKQLEHLPLELSVNLNDLNVYEESFWDRLGKFSIGGEFTLSEMLRLRLGYENELHRDLDTDVSDNFAGVSLGFGLNWNDYRFDYSFSSMGALGSVNRFGIFGTF
jgi:hypothetical protein